MFFVSIIALICLVTENHGKSIKIQIDCDDILKILAGLTSQDYKISDTPIEISKITAKVDRNGKIIGNPYHPEDSTDSNLASPSDKDKDNAPNRWAVKHEIEMDLMKDELEKKLDRENRNFIAKPAVISEDELEIVDTSKQNKTMDSKIDVVTEDYLQKIMEKKNHGNGKLQVDNDNIIRERKNGIEAVAIENNAVHVEKDFDAKVLNMNQKSLQLKKGIETETSDQIRIDYSPAKNGKKLSAEERAKRLRDNQDFKDFQRRFSVVDGREKEKK